MQGVENYPRIMRYSFRVNDSLIRVPSSEPPATTFKPLIHHRSKYKHFPMSRQFPSSHRNHNESFPYDEDQDYFPFEGSIMSPIFPEELRE